MPLIEETVVRTERNEIVDRKARTLYTLRELKEGKHIEGDVVEHRVANAYDNARENIRRMMDESGWTTDELETEISEYILPEILGKAGITTDDGSKSISWDVSPVQSGMFFALDPAHTRIDPKVFLRAMKTFFEGKDWRGPEYAASTQKPRLPQGKGIKRIDLRSSDAWHVRRDGVYMQIARQSMWDEELEIEPGYDYEHEFSEEFMRDCNDFLAEVTGFCLRTLRDTYEDDDEEGDLDTADINEWRFTREGEWA